MQILITAGGTKERIDEVRYIANHSTGRLGSIIAEAFANQPDTQVTYIHGAGAIIPSHPSIKAVPIFTSQDLETAIREELTHQPYDVVIHSMAVSDYTMDNAFSQEELLAELNKQLFATNEFINQETFQQTFTKLLATIGKENEDKKLSSSNEHLILRLKKTPKIIHLIKTLQPKTKLVGFKLLVDVPEEHLLTIAQQLLAKNDCDFVLANDLTSIEGDRHTGYLIDTDGKTKKAHTKQAIAEMIIESVTKKL